jgi:uncharacterized protein
MKIVIMSDTHSDRDIIGKVTSYYPEADYYIHCGDSELAANDVALQNVHKVGGNCDHDAAYEDDVLLAVGEKNLYITHGHLYNVKSSLMTLAYRAEEVGADIVCFGHSHVLGVEKLNSTLFINPGSLKLPRGRKEKTFVVLEMIGETYVVKCLDENNNLMDEFHYSI